MQHVTVWFVFVSQRISIHLYTQWRMTFSMYWFGVLGPMQFLGGHGLLGKQVPALVLLPTQDDAQGSIHASRPGTQCWPWLAPKANHDYWSQASPRKWIQLSNNGWLLTPAIFCSIIIHTAFVICTWHVILQSPSSNKSFPPANNCRCIASEIIYISSNYLLSQSPSCGVSCLCFSVISVTLICNVKCLSASAHQRRAGCFTV